MANKLFLNDRLVDAEAACVSVADSGLLHGVGLFETIRAYNGRPFRLAQHLERMFNSAERLDLPLRHSRDEVAAAVAAVLKANELREARLRITVTGGAVRAESDEPPQSTLLVTAAGQASYPASYYAEGMAVATAAARVNPADLIAPHKTLAYWPRLLTLQAARARHCGEALWFTVLDNLAEGCVSNVFLVVGGRVLTPSLDTPVLPGIARAAVIELCKAESIPVEERLLARDDVNAAAEAFLTNSIMEVMPVAMIDRKPVGEGKPGPITRRIAELYRQLVIKETSA